MKMRVALLETDEEVADRRHDAMADNNDNDDAMLHITLQAYWTIISSAAKICGGDQKGDKPAPA